MTRQEDISCDFLESDRIWPPSLAPTSFIEALKEVLLRLPDDAYDDISDRVRFVVDVPPFLAVNVPFRRVYPTCSNPFTVELYTIVVFLQALSGSHRALVGLLAHELAHSLVSMPDHRSNEEAADALAISWGFDRELEVMRAEFQ
jgi:hypothetical protein